MLLYIFFLILVSIRQAFRYHLPARDPKFHLRKLDYEEVYREKFHLVRSASDTERRYVYISCLSLHAHLPKQTNLQPPKKVENNYAFQVVSKAANNWNEM